MCGCVSNGLRIECMYEYRREGEVRNTHDKSNTEGIPRNSMPDMPDMPSVQSSLA
jgi:hypothetical protein